MARILSIEDDANAQRFIGEALFRDGYEVDYAWNGQEGYEKILEVTPDLILLDLMLPMMNGVELLKKLQDNKATRSIPVVIVTAFGDEASMLKSAVEIMGAAGYLRKPVQLQELLRIVKQALVGVLHSRRSAAESRSTELRKGCIRADSKFMTVRINDRVVATLSYKEFALLRRLMESPEAVLKEDLLQALGYEATQGDALKQAVHRLREAFGPSEKHRIKTTPQGYELIG